jgi:hypothetical protein
LKDSVALEMMRREPCGRELVHVEIHVFGRGV